MQIGEIWPFLLPGVLLQLLIQILWIVECVREGNRKPFHRALYILSIAVFGLRHCILPASRRKDTAQRYHHRRSGKG